MPAACAPPRIGPPAPPPPAVPGGGMPKYIPGPPPAPPPAAAAAATMAADHCAIIMAAAACGGTVPPTATLPGPLGMPRMGGMASCALAATPPAPPAAPPALEATPAASSPAALPAGGALGRAHATCACTLPTRKPVATSVRSAAAADSCDVKSMNAPEARGTMVTPVTPAWPATADLRGMGRVRCVEVKRLHNAAGSSDSTDLTWSTVIPAAGSKPTTHSDLTDGSPSPPEPPPNLRSAVRCWCSVQRQLAFADTRRQLTLRCG